MHDDLLTQELCWDTFLTQGCIFSANQNEVWVGWEASPCGGPRPGQLSLYTPDFFLEHPNPWQVFSRFQKINIQLLRQELRKRFPEASTAISPTTPDQWVEVGKTIFYRHFSELQGLFVDGVLKKAVPYAFEKTEWNITPSERARLLYALLIFTDGYPLILYGTWNLNEGILGATPEFLFCEQEDGSLLIPAIAGTRPRQLNENLLHSAKNLEEHQIVIDGILGVLRDSLGDDLGEQISQKVTVGKTQELVLPSLVHLYTPIIINERLSFSECISKLHPTPALGAYPRSPGKKWLRAYAEDLPRFRFGAPFGIIEPAGNRRCAVGIRNIQWKNNNEVYIGAGCGVVSASQVDLEWKEIQNKILSVKRMFQWF